MRYIATIILLAFCSLVYGQEKQKIAVIFVGEEPKKGTFKPFLGQMQMAIMKKYVVEDRTADFRKLAEKGNKAQMNKAVLGWGVKYIISIEMSEVKDGYYLEAKMMDAETFDIEKMGFAESKLESSKDVSTAALGIVAGLFDISENPSPSVASSSNRATFTDPRDKRIYETVQIGSHIWMAKNMNHKIGTSWCYDNENSNCEKYGLLYDWHTAMTVCPSGWKLPSRSEWNDLVHTIGKEVAGKKLKSREGQGTDDFGFSALLGGRRNTGGSFDYLKEDGRWWTSTLVSEGTNAYYQYMNIKMDYIDEKLKPNDFANGYSVRCVMGTPDPNTAKPAVASSGDNNTNKKPDNIFIDPRDKQEYKFVEIGNLVWMAKNMNHEIGTSYCYGKEAFNCKKYGRLYDWKTAKEACPTGWHLPSRGEWHNLIRSVDERTEKEKTTIFSEVGKEFFGLTGNLVGKAVDKVFDASTTDQTTVVGAAGNVASGKRLKSKQYNGTDNYGFSALLGGGRSNEKGFYAIDEGVAWWTATEAKNDPKKAYDMYIFLNENIVKEGSFNKSENYSVRCVKD